MIYLMILALAGIALSLYALLVSSRLSHNKNYKPFCDFSSGISCSTAFSSAHAKSAGLPNPYLGLAFYITVLILSILNFPQIIFLLSIPAILFTIFLAYISYIKMKNFCLVCSAVYLVNLLILILSYA